jgi:hypothetical protein
MEMPLILSKRPISSIPAVTVIHEGASYNPDKVAYKVIDDKTI